MAIKVTLSVVLLIAVVALGFSDDGKNDKQLPSLPGSVGTVAGVSFADRKPSDRASERLQFCVFENGKHDVIYVGTKFGGWYNGEFDLSFKEKVVFTGKVKALVYQGQTIDMGDVISTTGNTNFDLKITRVTGMFK